MAHRCTAGDAVEERESESGTQRLVYQEWPKSIFPSFWGGGAVLATASWRSPLTTISFRKLAIFPLKTWVQGGGGVRGLERGCARAVAKAVIGGWRKCGAVESDRRGWQG